MLQESEQVVLRKHAEAALMDTCTIRRPPRSSDGAGGFNSGSASTISGVKCRLSPVRNDFEQERIIAEALGAQIAWILSLPIGTDIRLNDYVEMTGANRLQVRAILTAPRSIRTVIRVVVLETK